MPSGFSPLQQHLAELLAPLFRALRFLVDPLSPLYWPYLLGGLLFALFAWRIWSSPARWQWSGCGATPPRPAATSGP